jgi:hypothetical protein
MNQAPQQGDNRTGIARSGALGAQMIAATKEFLPSSPGSALGIAEVRIAYAQQGDSLGEAPPPAGLMNKAKAAVTAATGGQPTLLMDKLGERLLFEQAGARLYEALVSKHRAYGSFDGGPDEGDLVRILSEEYEHADLLRRAIKDLGGDPTVVTPAANLAANISNGLPQVLSDPRTNLLQSLEAILVAELSDNECWTALTELAQQAGQELLGEQCRNAIAHERDHLRRVRAWIAAGQGRTPSDDGTEMMDATGAVDAEFTFTASSAIDAEGYAVSEEEAQEGRRGKGKAKGKGRKPTR